MDWRADDEKSCRVCGWDTETLPHVLNHCSPALHRGTSRHNKIVNRVKEAAPRKWKIISENQLISNTGLKPDLVLAQGKKLLILDVTCPYYNGYHGFTAARAAKIEKYQPLIQCFKPTFSDIQIDAIVVGSLGSWDPENDKVLLQLCTKKYLRLMKRLVVFETIRASRDIYVSHLNYNRTPQEDYLSREYRRFRITKSDAPNPRILPNPAPSGIDKVFSLIIDARDDSIPPTGNSPLIDVLGSSGIPPSSPSVDPSTAGDNQTLLSDIVLQSPSRGLPKNINDLLDSNIRELCSNSSVAPQPSTSTGVFSAPPTKYRSFPPSNFANICVTRVNESASCTANNIDSAPAHYPNSDISVDGENDIVSSSLDNNNMNNIFSSPTKTVHSVNNNKCDNNTFVNTSPN